MKIESIIRKAIAEAKKSEYKIKVGCVIFDKKKIISTGHNGIRNHKKLHPNFQRWKGSVHAEVDTIIQAKADLIGTTMLVVRINNNDELRLAKPCSDCMKYINHVGIKKVLYSTSNYPYISTL